MAKPKLYGISGSRAIRSLWAIEEVGIEYEHVSVNFMAESKKPEYLAVNPNGRIPALQDGDVTLFESMAINLYLAKTYGGDLYPRDPADEALVWQWSVWVMTEIEPAQMDIVIQKFFTPEEKRDATVLAAAEKTLARPLKVLDDTLAKRDWLVGDAFSIADLNVLRGDAAALNGEIRFFGLHQRAALGGGLLCPALAGAGQGRGQVV